MIKTLAPLALALSCLASQVTGVMAQNVPANVVKELAPNGKLRAAINFGNIVLAQKDPAGGEPRGVSAELARELAKRLGVPIEYVTFDAAGKVFDALKAGAWDVAFLAIDPVRSEGIEFTGPYVVIEGAYLVPSSSPLQTNEDVDREGVRVAVARGSAYDLYLTRALKRAQLVREQSGPQALDMFLKRSARGRGRRQAADRPVRQGSSGHARDSRPLHGHRAGHGDAQGARRQRALSARIHRRDEGLGLCRQGAREERPNRCRGRAADTREVTPPVGACCGAQRALAATRSTRRTQDTPCASV